MTPREVVEAQLAAYNRKDIEGFMEYWAEEAEYYAHPGTLLARGREGIRARHIERFKEPDLWGKLVSRTVIDDKVIDHEVVTRNFPEGKGTLEVVCIYEVKNEKIAKAWFILGNKRIDSNP
jgi:putative hydrolase of HD superfamily